MLAWTRCLKQGTTASAFSLNYARGERSLSLTERDGPRWSLATEGWGWGWILSVGDTDPGHVDVVVVGQRVQHLHHRGLDELQSQAAHAATPTDRVGVGNRARKNGID